MKEIDATTARRELRSILDRARIDGQPTAITRHGEAVALVVPVPADWLGLTEEEKLAMAQSLAVHHGSDA